MGDYYEPQYPDSSVLRPNLNSGVFQLDYWLSEDDSAGFYLYNSIGQMVEERRLYPPTGSQFFDLPYLSSGMYYWQVRRAGKVFSYGKMVVSK